MHKLSGQIADVRFPNYSPRRSSHHSRPHAADSGHEPKSVCVGLRHRLRVRRVTSLSVCAPRVTACRATAVSPSCPPSGDKHRLLSDPAATPSRRRHRPAGRAARAAAAAAAARGTRSGGGGTSLDLSGRAEPGETDPDGAGVAWPIASAPGCAGTRGAAGVTNQHPPPTPTGPAAGCICTVTPAQTAGSERAG